MAAHLLPYKCGEAWVGKLLGDAGAGVQLPCWEWGWPADIVGSYFSVVAYLKANQTASSTALYL